MVSKRVLPPWASARSDMDWRYRFNSLRDSAPRSKCERQVARPVKLPLDCLSIPRPPNNCTRRWTRPRCHAARQHAPAGARRRTYRIPFRSAEATDFTGRLDDFDADLNGGRVVPDDPRYALHAYRARGERIKSASCKAGVDSRLRHAAARPQAGRPDHHSGRHGRPHPALAHQERDHAAGAPAHRRSDEVGRRARIPGRQPRRRRDLRRAAEDRHPAAASMRSGG